MGEDAGLCYFKALLRMKPNAEQAKHSTQKQTLAQQLISNMNMYVSLC
jgi:hypothetical protein